MTVDHTPDTDVAETITAFLAERTGRAWTEDTDLFNSGVVSSLFAMELVTFIESRCGVTVSGPELNLDNFRSVGAMAALVHRLRAAG